MIYLQIELSFGEVILLPESFIVNNSEHKKVAAIGFELKTSCC